MERGSNKKEGQKSAGLQMRFFIIKRFVFIASAVSLITLAFGIYFFVIPQVRDKSSKEVRIKELNGEVDALSKSVTELAKNIEGNTILNLQRFDTLEKIIPPESAKEHLYLIMAQVVNDSGLLLESLSIGAPGSFSNFLAYGGGKYFKQTFEKVQLPIVVIPITIEVKDPSGAPIGYQKIKSIFDSLLISKRIFNISGLKFDQMQKDKVSSGRIENIDKKDIYKVTFDTFLLGDKKETP